MGFESESKKFLDGDGHVIAEYDLVKITKQQTIKLSTGESVFIDAHSSATVLSLLESESGLFADLEVNVDEDRFGFVTVPIGDVLFERSADDNLNA